MVDPYLWEHCMLGITLLGYAVLAINAFINRRQRWQLSEESKMMSECERCSVELANSLIPTSKAVPEYRFRGMRLKMSSIRIEFDNLGVKLKSTGQCIVEGVSGEFRPKRVAAIMGPSGAGKTTFMNALCGRAYYGTTTGAIRINGQTSSIAEVKQLRGFVPQDDIVHEHLTVREQLYYSARLRNAEDTPREMINNIVEDVLNVMQLLDVQHSIVGNVEKRGISGGQRKRVNIGLELAARPTILMLDEPTSGLDASTALEIIRSVKRLTAIGMTVVMVVHQPRYSLFTLFDDLLLLGLGGRTVYLGKSEGALPYFRNLGFQMPQHENPADWFMDVISGRVRNEKDPDLQPRQLADAWAELITVMPEELELGHDTSEGQHDSFAFTKALNGKLSSAGYEDVDELSQEQFLNFLDTMQIKRPSEASWARLMERMGFEDGFISRQKLVFFLLGLRGSFSQEPGTRGIGDFISSASESSKETSVSGIPTGKKLGRRGRFLIQYPILLHQNSIRWARDWKHKLISTCLIMFAAAVFGAPCQDKLIPENILCPLKINISHLPIGTLSSIACLHIFGSDRPLFWRESASGVGVTAFYLARLTVSLFDVLMWSYLHTAVWMLFSQAPCSFWMWLIAFRMTAMCASGVGIFMSTLVPKQNSTLATAVVILVMGGAMSEPQVIADAEGLSSALAFVSPFTWTAGQNYLALIDTSGGEEAVDFYAVMIMEGYQKILLCLGGRNLGYLTLTYIFCSVFAFLALFFGYLGLRFFHRGKQA
ncbi:Putative white-brown complex homolog protein 30 (Putative non-intrinsic ABC protein 12) (WBC-related protein 1) [Durusdinium trenchii]|uniref:White-brown complex homolog protein 30 (Putative non-intrinsic ABC protein 12) (WBC-related protein 1) n=1 Tax=Durusdinium trenchii TaxID=1381693 RepID=A0ABP0P5S9_9DINO